MESPNAQLHGFDGPFYSEDSARLQATIKNGRAQNAFMFRQAAATLPSFVQVERGPRTADGYSWYCSIEFGIETQSLRVLIPWADERAIAFYTKNMEPRQADQVLRHLANALLDQDQALHIENQQDSKSEGVVETAQKFDPRDLIKIWLDDRQIEPGFSVVSGKKLKAELAEVQYWPEGDSVPASARVWIFVTPIDSFQGLEAQLYQQDGAKVELTQIPSLLTSGDSVEVELDDNYYYDVLCIGYQEDGTGKLLVGGRYATTKMDKVPSTLTLDEAQLLALASIGYDPDQDISIPAVIQRMTAWGEYGRSVIVGFELGSDMRRSTSRDYGIMVSHLGNAEFYHGYTSDQTRQFVEDRFQPAKKSWLKRLISKH